jgi:hypothetical protein
MSYIQIIVQTMPPSGMRSEKATWRATAHRTDSVRRPEYRGIGPTEHAAAEDAVGQLLHKATSNA